MRAGGRRRRAGACPGWRALVRVDDARSRAASPTDSSRRAVSRQPALPSSLDEPHRLLQRVEGRGVELLAAGQVRPLLALRAEHEVVVPALVHLHAHRLAGRREQVVQRGVERQQPILGADDDEDRRADRIDVARRYLRDRASARPSPLAVRGPSGTFMPRNHSGAGAPSTAALIVGTFDSEMHHEIAAETHAVQADARGIHVRQRFHVVDYRHARRRSRSAARVVDGTYVAFMSPPR